MFKDGFKNGFFLSPLDQNSDFEVEPLFRPVDY